MEPAATIIAKLGGDTKVAEIVGVHRTRVANWKRAKDAGGTGGAIPFKHVPALISASQSLLAEPLTADDFLPPATAQPATAAA